MVGNGDHEIPRSGLDQGGFPPEGHRPDFAALVGQADAAYRPFAPFSDWTSVRVNLELWKKCVDELRALKEQSAELFLRSLEIVKRAAAVDTGAIERLYDTDWGFTLTVATQAAHVEGAFAQRKHEVKRFIEAQIAGYNDALDFATRKVPIAEAWIRELHAKICDAQEKYEVLTAIGIQEQPLPKGVYKALPNHVIESGGGVHSYAPVAQTPSEMHRLCVEIQGDEFEAANPMLQAAYAHHSFVAIHPFADGNGRVARALASVFSFRALSIPILILADMRSEYLNSLAAADRGDYQSFVDFFINRVVDAVRLIEESFRAATKPIVEAELSQLRRLYVTRGGYRHEDVDRAGSSLLQVFRDEISAKAKEMIAEALLTINIDETGGGHDATGSSYRVVPGSPRLRVTLASAAPARANAELVFGVEVPRDCGINDDARIVDLGGRFGEFRARVSELLPTPTSALRMRARIAVEGILGHALREITLSATKEVNRVYPST